MQLLVAPELSQTVKLISCVPLDYDASWWGSDYANYSDMGNDQNIRDEKWTQQIDEWPVKSSLCFVFNWGWQQKLR